MTITIPIKQVFLEYLNFKLNLTKDIPCDGQANLYPKEHTIDQLFKYQINVDKIESDEPPIVLKKSQDYSFIHNYKLVNDGPSPTNKIYEFMLYLPSLIIEDPTNVEKIFDFIPDRNPKIGCEYVNDTNSMAIPTIKNKQGFEPIACSSKDCVVYRCEIDEKWAKGDSKSVKIKMTLRSNLFAKAKSKLHKLDHFSVWTSISYKAGNNDTSYISENTDFVSNRSGNWQARIVEYWPIAVGLFVGIVVLAVLIYAFFKAGGLKKLRFFRMENENRYQ